MQLIIFILLKTILVQESNVGSKNLIEDQNI